MISAERTRSVVSRVFAAGAVGELQDVLGLMAADIVFEVPRTAHNTVIPYVGVWRGREAVAEAFRLRGVLADVTDFEQRELVVEGDRAFAVNFHRIRNRETGAEGSSDIAVALRVDDSGLISHWKAFFDTGAEAAVFRSGIGGRLHRALAERDHEQLRTLLADGADPDHRDPDTGLTALHTAAGLGDAVAVRALLAAGGDVYTGDSRAGGTALHKAVQKGDLETVRVLVEAGAFVDAVAPTTGHTPLMDALWYKWPDVVGYLLGRDAGLNLSTHYGFSLREHFEYELNVNTRGKEKLLEAEQLLKERIRSDEERAADDALMAAVVGGDAEAVRALLKDGADVDRRYPAVNGFNDAHTPLLVASRDGHTDIVRALLDAGADVNATEPTFGAVPLHKAVYNGHADITRLLAGHEGTNLDYQGATNGYTPLHDALWHGYEECARVLLDAGCRTDLVGHDGKTAGDVCAESFGSEHPLTLDVR